MSYNPNRLQFVHCETCFKNSAEAKEYVNGNLITHDRPALYAEPMVLKYGDEKNPNILLAIGSVGDGKTSSIENKVFFIDCAQLDVDNNFQFIDTNTIAFEINKHESGTTIEPNILLQPTKVVDKVEYDNIILNENGGLFTFVDTKVVDDQLIVNVNGEEKKYVLPDEVVRGEYNKEKLILTLFTKKDESIVVDFNDVVLISDNDKNIITKREDGLYANVELSYDKLTNVLSFKNGYEEKNINLLSHDQEVFYGDVIERLIDLKIVPKNSQSINHNIQKTEFGNTELISDLKLSVDNTNILKITDGGVYAFVDVDYDNSKNKLILTTSNGRKEFNLINQSFLESLSYDSVQKKIIMKVKLNDGNIITQEISVNDLFNPINVDNNVNSPIILNKTHNDNTGIDTITAHLNIIASDDNLLKVTSDGSIANLFASNRAEDIKLDWYSVDENGNIADPERIDLQTGFIRLMRYLSINDNVNSNLGQEIIVQKEQIGTIEKDLSELNEYVKEITNFGYTDDEEEENT